MDYKQGEHMPLLLDTIEAARRLGLAPATLSKMRVVGRSPPFIKIGTRVLYSETELAAWVDAQPRRTSTCSQNRAVGSSSSSQNRAVGSSVPLR